MIQCWDSRSGLDVMHQGGGGWEGGGTGGIPVHSQKGIDYDSFGTEHQPTGGHNLLAETTILP